MQCSCGQELAFDSGQDQTTCPRCGLIHASAQASGSGMVASSPPAGAEVAGPARSAIVLPPILGSVLASLLIAGSLVWAGWFQTASPSRSSPADAPVPSARSSGVGRPEEGPDQVRGPSGRSPAASPRPVLTPEQLSQAVSPAVVRIDVLDEEGNVRRGSGFFVRHDLVLTNSHVVEKPVILRVIDQNGKELFATRISDAAKSAEAKAESIPSVPIPLREVLVAKDAELDLVLLRMPPLPARAVLTVSAQPTPPVGTKVYVLGYPQGRDLTLSDGLLSSLVMENGQVRDIQMTAPISPGSSGGPVLTADGVVIGVAMAIDATEKSQNINFAIPAPRVSVFLARWLPTISRTLPPARAEGRQEQPAAQREEKIERIQRDGPTRTVPVPRIIRVR